jgi:hypothetical protein
MKRKKKMAAFSLLPKEGHVGLGAPYYREERYLKITLLNIKFLTSLEFAPYYREERNRTL